MNQDGATALEEQLNRQFGGRSGQMVEDARAALAVMPDRGRSWLLDAIDRVPPSTAAWIIHALAGHKPNAR